MIERDFVLAMTWFREIYSRHHRNFDFCIISKPQCTASLCALYVCAAILAVNGLVHRKYSEIWIQWAKSYCYTAILVLLLQQMISDPNMQVPASITLSHNGCVNTVALSVAFTERRSSLQQQRCNVAVHHSSSDAMLQFIVAAAMQCCSSFRQTRVCQPCLINVN